MERHITDRVDFANFGVPSWRIEQRFNTGVLIGNWKEERMKFPQEKYNHNTTNRLDFKNFKDAHPDVTVRRKAKLGSEGIPADMLFRHHGQHYDNMLISLYDENYNGRWRESSMPNLRNWDSQSLKWLPEKTDYPLKGNPTNFGLKAKLEVEREQKNKDLYYPDLSSTYQSSYTDKPVDAMKFSRYATPKHLSTNLLPCNKINNNLNLRGKATLRLPEIMPQELTTPSV